MATENQLRDYLKRAAVDLTESRRQLAALEDARHEPIAVIGMSCRFPGGADSVEDYWSLLSEGRSGVADVDGSRWNDEQCLSSDRGVYTRSGALLPDITGWDAEFFGASPNEAMRMDPQQRLLMELAWEGFENAGLAPEQLAGTRTSVLVGLMDTLQYGRLGFQRYGAGIAADPQFGQGATASVLAGRIAYHYDLRGGAFTVDTACSSSLVSVHLAVQALRRGECELALAAGVFLVMQPDTYVHACATSQLAPDGRTKTFDRHADGYVLGEGGGVVVLEPLSVALRKGRRIRAVLRGSALNQDGRSNGLTAPSRRAQVEVIRAAHRDARVEPDQIDYLEAHGSGTGLGDAIELSALHDVFGGRDPQRPLYVGAVKTNIGHTQSAAGIAGLIKTVLVLENASLPANLNLTDAAEALPTDGTLRPVSEPAPLPAGATLAGVSGFGWSGTNAHVVLESAPPTAPVTAPVACSAGPRVLPLSAAGGAALRERASELADRLEAHPDVSLADVAHTLGTGRAALSHRRAVVATDLDDAVAQLRHAATGVPARRRPRIAFLLPGVGDQYAGLGRELYRSEPVYAAAVDACIALVDQHGVDLRPLFFPPADAARPGPAELSDPAPDAVHEPETGHPFQFTVEYALAVLLRHRGVTPDVLVGYSLGEYVAACLAGVLSLPDALGVVVERARLIAGAASGRMLAAVTDEVTARAAIAATDAEVDVAAVNGPWMTVLSGTTAGVEAVAAHLRTSGIAHKRLRTAYAQHSWLLAPARDKLEALLATVELSAPKTTIVSNLTGRPITAAEATSTGYWAEHLVSPVRFAQSVQHCLDAGIDVFVELGAGQTLGGLVRRDLAGEADIVVAGTLPAALRSDPHGGDAVQLLGTCARLWEAGVVIDWSTTGSGQLTELPAYPWQRTRFWPDAEVTAPTAEPGIVSTAGPVAEPTDRCYTPTWRHTPTPHTPTPHIPNRRIPLQLAGPLVILADDGADPIGAALAALAADGGTEVVEVRLGADFARAGRRVTLDGSAPEHYRRLFAELPGSGPLHVVHLAGLSAPGPDSWVRDEAVRTALRLGYDTLLLAAQAFGETGRDVELITVSRGAAEIVGDDAIAPHGAAAHGLGRTLRHEYADVRWRGLDLDPAGHAVGRTAEREALTAARDIAFELTAAADASMPAMAGRRRGRRWVADWAPLDTTAAADAATADGGTDLREPVWRAEGAYLITGGTRGLGLGLARHLVRSGVRRLALASRSATRFDAQPLRDQGVEVLLLDVDTAEPDQLRSALRRTRERFGIVTGVVHAAGRPASGMVRRQTPAGARAVLATKVMALAPLAELVGPETPRDQRPELVVLYSSAVSAFGAIGESDYCAANTVLDAYAQALSATAEGTRVVSVAWGPWQHDAWQANADSELASRARAYRERFGFADEAGCALLDRVLRTGASTVVALRQPMDEAAQAWSGMLDITALVDASSAPTSERFPRPDLRTQFVAARTSLERLVAGVWEQYLGIDGVGVHDPFFDLGGNSLVGLAMVHSLERELNTHIAPATLFEHPTVAEFALALDRADNPAGGTDPSTSQRSAGAGRGQRRRQARVTGRRGTSA